jgi:hypothetical protein
MSILPTVIQKSCHGRMLASTFELYLLTHALR